MTMTKLISGRKLDISTFYSAIVVMHVQHMFAHRPGPFYIT